MNFFSIVTEGSFQELMSFIEKKGKMKRRWGKWPRFGGNYVSNSAVVEMKKNYFHFK